MRKGDDNIEVRLHAALESDSAFPARSAVASFLFMVMPVDGQTHPKELDRLSRILSDDFDLDKEQTEALIAHAKKQQKETANMESLAELLKSELSKNELLLLISHMWEMVFADGRLHETEVLLVERVASLLDIPKDEVAGAMIS